jgi:hypothetical protein
LTLEFIYTPSQQGLANMEIVLFEQEGDQSIRVGDLGNPTVNPTSTQWPQSVSRENYTVYIDFHPLTPFSLQPDSHYLIGIKERTFNPSWDVGLLFTRSPQFTTPADWQMGQTTTHDRYANGEFLKFGLDATPIPEPLPTTLMLLAGAALAVAIMWQRNS